MKKIVTILILMISFVTNAQNYQVVDIANHNIDNSQTGFYYKDVNNIFNMFEGTFLYEGNGITLEFNLQKKEMSAPPTNAFLEDYLIGGFRYVLNGQEISNTLNDAANNYNDAVMNVIFIGNIFQGNHRWCSDCAVDEYWLEGSIKDPISGYRGRLYMKKTTHNGQEAIKVTISFPTRWRNVNEPELPAIQLPHADHFILIKQ
jgi:hypothetical protein